MKYPRHEIHKHVVLFYAPILKFFEDSENKQPGVCFALICASEAIVLKKILISATRKKRQYNQIGKTAHMRTWENRKV